MPRHRTPLALLCLALFACDRPQPTSPLADTEAVSATPMSAVMTVTSTADAGAGSLRDAIASAPLASSTTIEFDPTVGGQTITLSTGELVIEGKTIVIQGPATGITISGGGVSRVLRVAADAALTLRNATITGGVSNAAGAGVYALGSLTIDHSTISGNTMTGTDVLSAGGGIFANQAVSISNTTISGNRAGMTAGSGVGGGLVINGSTATNAVRELVNVTITNNHANGTAGGVAFVGSVIIRNVLIAGNQSPGFSANCAIGVPFVGTAVITYGGRNLSDDVSCGPAGAIMHVVPDAMLGGLASNGGPTQTHALLVGSLAIDGGAFCTVTDDQRYVARPAGSACDIGAYEFTDFVPPPVSFDPSATVNNRSGIALISGSIDCTAAGTTSLELTLSQAQKVGKINIVVQATATTTVSCISGAAPWSAFLAPANGAFQNGATTATARVTSGLAPGYASTVPPTVVKLFWSKG